MRGRPVTTDPSTYAVTGSSPAALCSQDRARSHDERWTAPGEHCACVERKGLGFQWGGLSPCPCPRGVKRRLVLRGLRPGETEDLCWTFGTLKRAVRAPVTELQASMTPQAARHPSTVDVVPGLTQSRRDEGEGVEPGPSVFISANEKL